MLPFKTILHPTDFGDSSQCALELACGLAADHNAHLVVIHVIAAPSSARFLFTGAHARLSSLEIPDDEIEVVRRVEEGNPATEILNMALLCHADLIVLGSRGRTDSPGHMGSVAETVMRMATCPVLTLTARNAHADQPDVHPAHI